MTLGVLEPPVVFIPLALFVCFVDQTSANKMVTAVLKSCIAGILVFSFCTAGIVKITNKIAPQAYEQMVSCIVHVIIHIQGYFCRRKMARLVRSDHDQCTRIITVYMPADSGCAISGNHRLSNRYKSIKLVN